MDISTTRQGRARARQPPSPCIAAAPTSTPSTAFTSTPSHPSNSQPVYILQHLSTKGTSLNTTLTDLLPPSQLLDERSRIAQLPEQFSVATSTPDERRINIIADRLSLRARAESSTPLSTEDKKNLELGKLWDLICVREIKSLPKRGNGRIFPKTMIAVGSDEDQLNAAESGPFSTALNVVQGNTEKLKDVAVRAITKRPLATTDDSASYTDDPLSPHPTQTSIILSKGTLPRDMEEWNEWIKEWEMENKSTEPAPRKDGNEMKDDCGGMVPQEEEKRTALGRKIKSKKGTANVKTKSTANTIQTKLAAQVPSRECDTVEHLRDLLDEERPVETKRILVGRTLLVVDTSRQDETPAIAATSLKRKKQSARNNRAPSSGLITWTATKASLDSASGVDGEKAVDRNASRRVRDAGSPSPGSKPRSVITREPSRSPGGPSHGQRSPRPSSHPHVIDLDADGDEGDDEMEPTQTDESTLAPRKLRRLDAVDFGGVLNEAQGEQAGGVTGSGVLQPTHQIDKHLREDTSSQRQREASRKQQDQTEYLSLTGLHDASILDAGGDMEEIVVDVVDRQMMPPSFPDALVTSTPKHLQPVPPPGEAAGGDVSSPSSTPTEMKDITLTRPFSKLSPSHVPSGPPIERPRIALDSDDDEEYVAPKRQVPLRPAASLLASQASSTGYAPPSSFAQQPDSVLARRAEDNSRAAMRMLGRDVMDLLS